MTKNKTRLLLTLATTALTLGVQSASAADLPPVVEEPGWYATLFGGVSFMDDLETEYSYSATPGYELEVETDTGFIVGGALGTHLGAVGLSDAFRAELEVAFSSFDVDDVEYAGVNYGGVRGF